MNCARATAVLWAAAAALACSAGCAPAPLGPAAGDPLRADRVDVVHGFPVPDPWRALEASDDPRVRRWVETQNARTRAWLDATPARAAIRARLAQRIDFARFGLPWREGGKWFWFHNSGLQEHPVLYTGTAPDADGRVLLDPTRIDPDSPDSGAAVALSGVSVSPDGRWLAWGSSRSGSDWQRWQLRDVATGRDLPDRIERVKFSGASWAADASGFWYSRYAEPPEGEELRAAQGSQSLYFHVPGTPQSADRLVLPAPPRADGRFRYSARASREGRWLVVTVARSGSQHNALWVGDLASERPLPRPLLDDFDARYRFVGAHGGELYVWTDRDAPFGRLVAIDPSRPGLEHWREVVSHPEQALVGARFAGDHIVAHWLADAHSRLSLHGRDGDDLGPIELPGLGSVGGVWGRAGEPEFYFAFSGFTRPRSIWRCRARDGACSLSRAAQLDLDSADYRAEQVFYTSRDGTRVPMFVVGRADLPRDGMRPTLLHGYGGFGISTSPRFGVANLVWLELGGVLALPGLRGGGEYGRAWHDAGRLERKQNVFDDFIAAAEYLTAAGYTRPDRLAISGRSNGGLLVAASLAQRPRLFGAALVGVGVLDMLRFHRFTIGHAWTSEYGDPDDPEDFANLYGYSPLHNLRAGTPYPATLVYTSDSDDRVVPAHSYKFAAALQEAQGADRPVLLRVETMAGHGAGTPTSRRLDAIADRFAFLAQLFEMRVPQFRAHSAAP